jgi:hypothetical protein
MPVLAAAGGSSGFDVALLLSVMGHVVAKLAVLALGALAVSRTVLPPAMRALSRRFGPDSFQLAAIAFCLLCALGTARQGISPELGAFVAGVMLSATEQQDAVLHHLGEQLVPLAPCSPILHGSGVWHPLRHRRCGRGQPLPRWPTTTVLQMTPFPACLPQPPSRLPPRPADPLTFTHCLPARSLPPLPPAEPLTQFFLTLFISSTGLVLSPVFLLDHLPILAVGAAVVIASKTLLVGDAAQSQPLLCTPRLRLRCAASGAQGMRPLCLPPRRATRMHRTHSHAALPCRRRLRWL